MESIFLTTICGGRHKSSKYMQSSLVRSYVHGGFFCIALSFINFTHYNKLLQFFHAGPLWAAFMYCIIKSCRFSSLILVQLVHSPTLWWYSNQLHFLFSQKLINYLPCRDLNHPGPSRWQVAMLTIKLWRHDISKELNKAYLNILQNPRTVAGFKFRRNNNSHIVITASFFINVNSAFRIRTRNM